MKKKELIITLSLLPIFVLIFVLANLWNRESFQDNSNEPVIKTYSIVGNWKTEDADIAHIIYRFYDNNRGEIELRVRNEYETHKFDYSVEYTEITYDCSYGILKLSIDDVGEETDSIEIRENSLYIHGTKFRPTYY